MLSIEPCSNIDDVIEMKPKQIRRFYEPLVLFHALNEVGAKNGRPRESRSSDTGKTPKDRFKQFVWHLANTCDRLKGGTTVTSIAVLQGNDGCVNYVYACNQVSSAALKETGVFLVGLLKLVRDSDQSGEKALLNYILSFVRPRVEIYFRHLRENTNSCIDSCNQRGEPENAKRLQMLADVLSEIHLEGVDGPTYIALVNVLYKAIKTLFRVHAGIKRTLDSLANEGRSHVLSSMECWSEFRHHINRFEAYEQCVSDFLKAKSEWPDLFDTFHVRGVPSSKPARNPLQWRNNKADRVKEAIGRMTSDETDRERFRAFAASLEQFGVNARMIEQSEKEKFRPKVHSELLLLDWCNWNRQELGLDFFQNFKFIGASKPTCKLCNYYFHNHPSKIEVRPSHGNLYLSWRFPDVLKKHGERAARKKQKMVDRLMELIRDDAFKIMESKAPMTKKHDSNSYDLASMAYSTISRTSGVLLGRPSEREVSGMVDGLADLVSEKLNLVGPRLDISEARA